MEDELWHARQILLALHRLLCGSVSDQQTIRCEAQESLQSLANELAVNRDRYGPPSAHRDAILLSQVPLLTASGDHDELDDDDESGADE